jgi:hypothetical protein
MLSPTAHDEIRLCYPDCRDAFLTDLGLSGHGGGWAFPARGQAMVRVAWSGIRYQVSWARRPPSARLCDLCGDEWTSRPARMRAVPPPSEAQVRSRAAFAARARAGGWKTGNPDVASPGG